MSETTGEVALRPDQSSMSIRDDQTYWTDGQARALVQAAGIRDKDGNPPPKEDLMVFFHLCRARQLDPFSREIYLIERFTQGKKAWVPQVAIGGLWKIAHRSAPGMVEAGPVEWANSNGVWRDVWLEPGTPTAARVTIFRDGHAFPATVNFREFAGTTRDGSLTAMWSGKPAHMIGKCAEAAALRKAFPADMAGLYTDDEMSSQQGGQPRRMVGRQSVPSLSAAQLRDRVRPKATPAADLVGETVDEPTPDPETGEVPREDWADQEPSGPDPWQDPSAVRQPATGIES